MKPKIRKSSWPVCFDHPDTFDRYTIVEPPIDGREWAPRYYMPYVGSSENPTHPLGFWQHGEDQHRSVGQIMVPIGRKVEGYGKRIHFTDLPEAVQRCWIREERQHNENFETDYPHLKDLFK